MNNGQSDSFPPRKSCIHGLNIAYPQQTRCSNRRSEFAHVQCRSKLAGPADRMLTCTKATSAAASHAASVEPAPRSEGKLAAPRSDAQHNSWIWCPECHMWLNGPKQFEDHEVGKLHKKKLADPKVQRRGPPTQSWPFQGSDQKRQECIAYLEHLVTALDADDGDEPILTQEPQASNWLDPHGSQLWLQPNGCIGRDCEGEINAACKYCKLQFCPWHWSECVHCAAVFCSRCAMQHRHECKATVIKINASISFTPFGTGP